jgi:hypothetical protein
MPDCLVTVRVVLAWEILAFLSGFESHILLVKSCLKVFAVCFCNTQGKISCFLSFLELTLPILSQVILLNNSSEKYDSVNLFFNCCY